MQGLKHLTRQWDIIPIDILDNPINIIGAGAIGGFAALSLAKMGFSNMTVWDFDSIETENLSCQFYPKDSVGQPKVTALKELIAGFTHNEIKDRNERYTVGALEGVVVSAVDTMSARKMIWDNHKHKANGARYIIDPRMGAEDAMLCVVDPNRDEDIKSYEKTLYSDAEAVPAPCTAKSTMYTALMLAGLVCKAVKDIMTGSNDYPRFVQWSIKHNAMVASKGRA